MARPSKSTPHDWTPAKDWTSLLKRLRCANDSEDSAVDQLRLQLLTKTLHLMIGCAKVVGEVCAGASVKLVLLAPSVAVQELAVGVDCGP